MILSYRTQADALDNEIVSCIERWNVPAFGDLALRIFAHQVRYNEAYAAYCHALGVVPASVSDWESIPPVPSAAFKEAPVCTFPPHDAALVFETSGTTQGRSGQHFMESSRLYDAALLAGFERGLLAGVQRPIRFLNLVPDPRERPASSLGYMMRACAARFGDGKDGWFLHGEALDAAAFTAAVRAAHRDGVAVCVAGTAFAFVRLAEILEARGIAEIRLPEGSRVMETGGFKGRTRVVARGELYGTISRVFALPVECIIAEYGMTELTSQYYDRPSADAELRVKFAPPWLRPRVVGPDGKTLPRGTVGALVHVDLANRSSAVAIQTEDLGVATQDGGLILIGREHGAELRGCSLDAEQLRAAARVRA